MGASVEEIMQVFSNLAGATAGTPTTQNRAAASNKATQNSLAAKYQRDMEEQRKKQEKAGIFGKLGGAVGGTLGTLVGGPVGGVIGSTLGGGAGTAVGGGNNPLEVAAGNAASGLAGMGASKLGGAMPQLAPMDTSGQLSTGNVDLGQAIDSVPQPTPQVQVSKLAAPDVIGDSFKQYNPGQRVPSMSGLGVPYPAGDIANLQSDNSLVGSAYTYDSVGNPIPNQPMLVGGMDVNPHTSYTSPEEVQRQLFPTTKTNYATGGLVTDNQPKIVGEQGPEVMIPGAGSMILPNLALRGLANYIDPTTGLMGKPNPNPVQQSMQGGNPHAVANTMQQQYENTGVGTRFQSANPNWGTQGAPLTPEAQKKQQIADTMRSFGARGGLNNIIGAARQFSDMGGFENFSVAPRVDAARIPVGLDTERALAVKGAFDTADKQAMDERRMKLEERGAKVAENQGQQRIDTDKQRVNLEGQAMEQRAAEGEKNRQLEEKLARSKMMFEGDQQTAELNNRITLQGLDASSREAMNNADNRTQLGIAAAQLRQTAMHYADMANKEVDEAKRAKQATLSKMLDEAGLAQAQRYDSYTGTYTGGNNAPNIKGIESYLKLNPDMDTPEARQALEVLRMANPTEVKAPGATTTVPPLDASSFFSK